MKDWLIGMLICLLVAAVSLAVWAAAIGMMVWWVFR